MRIVVALGGNALLKRAAIGTLKDIEKIVAGEAGTNVYPS